MACFGQGETWLGVLHREALGEQGGVLVSPLVRRVGVDLAVERAEFVEVRGGLVVVEQAEGDIRLWHHSSPARAGAALRRYSRSCSGNGATSATSGYLPVSARSKRRSQFTTRVERVSAAR